MDTLIRDDKVDAILETMTIQQRTISVVMTTIYEKIIDASQRCAQVSSLLDQLELLCRKTFEYDEQLLEEMHVPSVEEQRRQHGQFLDAVSLFRAGSDQCHSSSSIKDFIRLRLDYITTLNNETMMLCDLMMKA